MNPAAFASKVATANSTAPTPQLSLRSIIFAVGRSAAMLGVPSSNSVTSTSVATLAGGYFGDAVVDSNGTIHATVIDRAGNLRYLTLGP